MWVSILFDRVKFVLSKKDMFSLASKAHQFFPEVTSCIWMSIKTTRPSDAIYIPSTPSFPSKTLFVASYIASPPVF